MTRLLLAICILLSGVVAAPAMGGTTSEFYKGKEIHLIVGYPAGSGYDFHARALAHHLARHIPGDPGIVVENMVGAASLKATNYLYNKAPRNGTYIGAVSRFMLLLPLLQTVPKGNMEFDPLKFVWIGSMNSTSEIGFVWATTGITSFDDAFKREIIVAASPPSGESYMISNVLNNLLGTKLKIVAGYQGSNASFLAIERGEVQGYFGSSLSTLQTTRPQWLTQKKINVLVQIATKEDPALPNVPLVMRFAKTDRTRKALELILAPEEASRPYLAPPGVPKDRAEALRAAFDAAMKDPAFLAEAAKSKIDVSPVSGAEIEKMLRRVYATPEDVVLAAREALKVHKGDAKSR